MVEGVDHWTLGETVGWTCVLELDLLEDHNQELEGILQDVEDVPCEQEDSRDIEIGFVHHHHCSVLDQELDSDGQVGVALGQDLVGVAPDQDQRDPDQARSGYV